MRKRERIGSAGQATDYNITRGIHSERWITKAADTHSEYVILSVFPRQQCLR
jgi:hypothetical protein